MSDHADLEFGSTESVFVSQAVRTRIYLTIEMEHIRISSDSSTEVCICRLLPLRLQSHAVNVLETHRCHAASSDVKTSSDNDDIELMDCAVLQFDAFGGESNDWVVLDVNNIYVRTVELFVVGLFETGTLDAEGMRRF